MSNPSANRAMSAATASLVAFGASLYLLLQHTVEAQSVEVGKTVLLACVIAASMALHFIFVGMAAHHLNRRAWVWVLVAFLGFPISSIVGLVLLAYFDVDQQGLPAAR
ncbi:hypothetical protein [Piscinibacter terrae]|uniref:DUF2834 domain-containing protein n=1 Tax=Piscinibacter terrae TaxID=2496871 RepID=A0A3N7HX95_9BURK|nr:hypothetical protein [Albitalea terrae]RQP26066.1 hypothetical protein DZC73_03200 [Albitalea terrae]